MGGIGNVVVNTIVRMFTRKAVGKAIRSAESVGGKKKGDPDRENTGIRADELPESGGLPPAAILATGSLLLASSLMGLSLALRRGVRDGA